MSRRIRRLSIAGLSIVGMVEALYMLSYSEKLIDSLVCPFFGKGCNIVGRSEQARQFGVPNSGVGAVAYAVMAVLALWSGDRQSMERRWQPLALSGVASLAVGASAFLTWAQAARVRAWCFWCLTSAAINVVILALSLVDATPIWRNSRRDTARG